MIAIFISKDDDEYKAYCSMPILSKVDESILISKTCPERVPYRLININGLTNIVCNGDSKYFPSKQSAMRKGWIKSEDYFLIFISVLYAIVKSRYLEENEGVYIFAHMGGNANFVNLELAAEKIIKCVPELRCVVLVSWHSVWASLHTEHIGLCFNPRPIGSERGFRRRCVRVRWHQRNAAS